jgi:hypothetical protein
MLDSTTTATSRIFRALEVLVAGRCVCLRGVPMTSVSKIEGAMSVSTLRSPDPYLNIDSNGHHDRHRSAVCYPDLSPS